ncbi:MAG: phage/plasmid primase, P4 family [Pseudomonadota bacterium]
MKFQTELEIEEINTDAIPAEMKAQHQWVCWREVKRKGPKPTKVPINPKDGSFAKVNEPSTWGRFEDAIAWYHSGNCRGIGFVFTKDAGFVGIDLDGCLDPTTGIIQPAAEKIVSEMGSYTEISPSGCGLHIIVQGVLPHGGRRRHDIEIYDEKRFFTITGDILPEAIPSVARRDQQVLALYSQLDGSAKPAQINHPTLINQTSEDTIVEKAMNAKNGDKFSRLWRGDFGDYHSQSEADLSLCSMLAYWTSGDRYEIDRLFRRSGLYRPKWDESHYGNGKTYGQVTIEKALASPGKPSGHESPAQATNPKQFNLTDMGNAERLVHHFGSDIRYCHVWRSWLIWDGKRWGVDKKDKIRQLAKEVVRLIYREAENEADDRKRQEIAKHAMQSESEKRIRSMVSLATSEVPITPEELDVDPWLLTCLNGTVDLKTGNLLSHQREHLIRQLAPVHYDPDTNCPLWQSFLDRIMAGNAHLISFLQRAIGYSLTGETSEQCLFIFYGSGANGKTTFLQAINAMLGEYAMQTPTETLLVKQRGAIPNDVARLKGARFVTASEAESEQRFAESLIKQMTGGDTLSARFLHQEWFDFVPTHKVFLGTNHKPVIKETDHAIWRRIKLVPFEVTIPECERDLQLSRKLKSELPGILAWAVSGCLDWQRQGLGTPDEVKAATEDYRNEMDVMSEFIADRCIEGPSHEVRTKDVYEAYVNWCEGNGERPLSKRAMGLKLKERGYMPGKVGQDRSRGWKGLGLQADTWDA